MTQLINSPGTPLISAQVYAAHARKCLLECRPRAAVRSAENAVVLSESPQWLLLLARAYMSNGETRAAQRVLLDLGRNSDDKPLDRNLVDKWSKLSLGSLSGRRKVIEDDDLDDKLAFLTANIRDNETKLALAVKQKKHRKKAKQLTFEDDDNSAVSEDYDWVTDDEEDDDGDAEEVEIEIFEDAAPIVVKREDLITADADLARSLVREDLRFRMDAKAAAALELAVVRVLGKFRSDLEMRQKIKDDAYRARDDVHQVYVDVAHVDLPEEKKRFFKTRRISTDLSVEECERRPEPTAIELPEEALLSEAAELVSPQFSKWIHLEKQRFFLDEDPRIDSKALGTLVDFFEVSAPAPAPPKNYPILRWLVGKKTTETLALPPPLAVPSWDIPANVLLPHYVLIVEVWHDDPLGPRQCVGEARLGIGHLLASLPTPPPKPREPTESDPSAVTIPLRLRPNATKRERDKFHGGSVRLHLWAPAVWSLNTPESVAD